MAEREIKPRKCNPKIVAKIGEMVSGGASLRNAAGSVGIGNRTLQYWNQQAKKGVEPYKTLLRPLKKALCEAKARAEQRVYSGKGTWQSSARWLESLAPDLWRRTERREVSQTGDLRISWPDLSKSGPSMAEKRAAAVDEALRKPGRN